MKAVIPIASACACALLLASAPAAPLDEAEQAMQARQFDTAVALLSKAGAGDYPSYLKAVALYQAEEHSEAASTCEALLRDFPGSEWQHKARFLMARALIAQKDHQAAESILAGEAERIFSPDRKQSIATVLVDFADKLAREPDPNELDALPADDEKALALYQQVLALEIKRELRDDIQFKVALDAPTPQPASAGDRRPARVPRRIRPDLDRSGRQRHAAARPAQGQAGRSRPAPPRGSVRPYRLPDHQRGE